MKILILFFLSACCISHAFAQTPVPNPANEQLDVIVSSAVFGFDRDNRRYFPIGEMMTPAYQMVLSD
ncbi:hypothetical protein FE392_07285 [Xenorhabdus sp. 12]|uniref:Uncharacterized protein n=1 Tax=Xenorhabdus santafensis TaxID=2582833 RepID=A0ABU4S8L6_9GAMM|nr:hypothetical protein [Xenorhabdus sp. 12]